jgi:cytochrome c553
MLNIYLVRIFCVLFGFAAITNATAVDLTKAKKTFATVCASCHGYDGKTPTDASIPKLAGQHQDYLYHAMLEYRNGVRKNPLMQQQMEGSRGISKEDLSALATYISKLPSGLSTAK